MKANLLMVWHWLHRCHKCKGKGYRKTWMQGSGRFVFTKCSYCNGTGKRNG